MLGISIKLLQPSAQHIVVEIKITRRLHNRNAAILDQINRLELQSHRPTPNKPGETGRLRMFAAFATHRYLKVQVTQPLLVVVGAILTTSTSVMNAA